jgi:hypothetical protein
MAEAAVFFSLGVAIMCRSLVVRKESNDRRFRTFFGTSPAVCARIWVLVKPFETMPTGVKPVHLLWALMFLKLYCAESVHATLAGAGQKSVDEKTFRKWSWLFVESINHLKYEVILFANRFRGDVGNICLISVDGTDFRIFNILPFWTGWYSHKFKGPGLRYEVALNIMTGDIVWINGPFPCGRYPDITIFRSALKDELEPGEMAEADLGYRGEPGKIRLPIPGDDVQQRVRSRHETVNRRFKQFSCLGRVFRHNLGKHGSVFGAVAVITQLGIEDGDKLFDVSNYRS